MGFKNVDFVFEHSNRLGTRAMEHLMMLALAHTANDITGKCYQSRVTLKRLTHIQDDRTFENIRDSLVRKGLMTYDSENTSHRKSTDYYLHFLKIDVADDPIPAKVDQSDKCKNTATDQPCKITSEPCKITSEPCKITSEPCKITGPTNNQPTNNQQTTGSFVVDETDTDEKRAKKDLYHRYLKEEIQRILGYEVYEKELNSIFEAVEGRRVDLVFVKLAEYDRQGHVRTISGNKIMYLLKGLRSVPLNEGAGAVTGRNIRHTAALDAFLAEWKAQKAVKSEA